MGFSLPLWAAVPALDKFDDTHILIFLGISHAEVCVHCPSAFQCVYHSQNSVSIFFIIPLGHLRYQITASQAFPSRVWTIPVLSLSLYVLCPNHHGHPLIDILQFRRAEHTRCAGFPLLKKDVHPWAHWLCPCSWSLVCGSPSLAQICSSLACDTWRFSSSSAGQAMFGAGWHWHWWHNWPWGVMETDGTWGPGPQTVALDTWLTSVDTRIFALSYNSGVILSECSFSPGSYISLTVVMQLAEWCVRSPVGVLPALWETQAWWEREQQYKAWLCFQMLPAKGPQAGWQGSLGGTLNIHRCQFCLRKQSWATAILTSFPSSFTSFSSARGRQLFTWVTSICLVRKEDKCSVAENCMVPHREELQGSFHIAQRVGLPPTKAFYYLSKWHSLLPSSPKSSSVHILGPHAGLWLPLRTLGISHMLAIVPAAFEAEIPILTKI